MTREETLYSMRMVDLVKVADKLSIKVNRKSAKSEAIEKILVAEEMNTQNEKELVKEEIEAVKVEEPELVPMPGAEKLTELKDGYIDPTLLAKLTKKEQKLVTSLFKNEKGYHVTYEFNGKSDFFDSKSMYKIGLKLKYTYKGE